MRGLGHDRHRKVGEPRREQKRDRAAVAVPDQDWLLYPGLVEHRRQGQLRLVVQVAGLAGAVQGLGLPMAPAVIDQTGQAKALAQLGREVPPQRDRAQTLVQEDKGRPRAGAFGQ